MVGVYELDVSVQSNLNYFLCCKQMRFMLARDDVGWIIFLQYYYVWLRFGGFDSYLDSM